MRIKAIGLSARLSCDTLKLDLTRELSLRVAELRMREWVSNSSLAARVMNVSERASTRTLRRHVPPGNARLLNWINWIIENRLAIESAVSVDHERGFHETRRRGVECSSIASAQPFASGSSRKMATGAEVIGDHRGSPRSVDR